MTRAGNERMAVIECAGCGETVPDQAIWCPTCGRPVASVESRAPERPEKTCPKCAERVLAAARVCKHCGQDFERAARGGCGPALLSLLLPGLGQLVKGEVLAGVVYFLVAVALWAVFLGWAVNIVSAVAAYSSEA